MSKKRRLEWSFFLNDRSRVTYNELCRRCRRDCKQSFRAVVIECPKYLSKRSRKGAEKKRENGAEPETAEIPLEQRAHYPRYSTIRGNFQIVAIYKDFKEISSDNVTTILESPATDSPFSVLQNFPFAGRTISRSNPGYACSQSPVKAQRTVRS